MNGNPESVYYYIASVNGDEAVDLLVNQYGFSIVGDVSAEDIANKLYEIVQADGQPALIDVMNLHPDKTMILELYANPNMATCATTNSCATTAPSAPTTIPSLPMCGPNGMSQMCGNKPFFSNPTHVMIAAVGVIAFIALYRPKS